ncbi:DUF1444 domain-containing protein [Bacillus sp. CECT 9360]|uniref:DUF1444 domain-containing protein n=1 Tax=Bacillus sp. CECT 9360 TaxID=2845821 RepID=UPI001E57C676|nr:DUF1444 domain-containing protein [Bacillus sp. CECT 9360]CAH0346831.1 hypothetical protein BCI9360_03195 [Bacillus sp. CECT 9360]
MKMDGRKMKDMLKQRIGSDNRTFSFDSKKDVLRIENTTTGKGISIELAGIIAKWETLKEKAVDEVVYYVEEALNVMGEEHTLEGREKQIYPVIRSTSFPEEAAEGNRFFFDEHTAETRIYYALDLGNTYRLIDEELLKKENWDTERIRQVARFNVRSLATSVKADTVAENTFYFLNTNDGYDASRILNEAWLREMKGKMKGTMAIAIPHQDVIIIADVENDTGYDILAQMAMSFFASGHVPITALSFLYEEDGLEPIFILGKNKKREQ